MFYESLKWFGQVLTPQGQKNRAHKVRENCYTSFCLCCCSEPKRYFTTLDQQWSTAARKGKRRVRPASGAVRACSAASQLDWRLISISRRLPGSVKIFWDFACSLFSFLTHTICLDNHWLAQPILLDAVSRTGTIPEYLDSASYCLTDQTDQYNVFVAKLVSREAMFFRFVTSRFVYVNLFVIFVILWDWIKLRGWILGFTVFCCSFVLKSSLLKSRFDFAVALWPDWRVIATPSHAFAQPRLILWWDSKRSTTRETFAVSFAAGASDNMLPP